MKRVLVFIFFLCFGSFIADAQDWQCIRDSTTTCFANQTLWTIKIDSVKEINGYKYYYGFKSPRVISEFSTQYNTKGKCIDPFGPSRMGKAMSAGISGNFFFNSKGEAIRFCTDRQPGNPWICCQISDSSWLNAVVSQVTVEPVLDVYDSVKTISFQAVDPMGNAIYHPLNNEVFKVSKNYGMITLYDFAEFPEYNEVQSPVHILSGFHSPSYSTGDDNLTRRIVYGFSPGDIFCTENKNWGSHGGPYIDSTYRIILDSAWDQTGDVVTYTIVQYRHFWDNDWHRSYYFKDTLQISYNDMNSAEYQPEESELTYSPEGAVLSVNASIQMQGDINSRWSRLNYLSGWYDSEAPCGDSLLAGSSLQPVAGIYGNVEGCGGVYHYSCYTDEYFNFWCSSFLLIYMKKGDETWGTPFDTTRWVSPNATEEPDSLDFRIFPNPASGQVIIKLPLMPGPDYSLDIRSSLGALADRIRITGIETRYDVSHLNPGIYIISLYDGRKLIGNLKLVR